MRTFAAAVLSLLALLIPIAAASAKQPPAAHWAKRHHLKGHWRGKDADRDGLANLREFKLKTDPRKADTDGDGLDDGDELRSGDDPLDRDSDADGVNDGAEHAGVVTAFDGTTITVRQFHGPTITAAVDAGVDCSGGDDAAGDDDAAHAASADDTGDDTEDDAGVDDSSDDAVDDSADAGEPTCADLGVKPGAIVAHLELDRADDGSLVVSEIELAG